MQVQRCQVCAPDVPAVTCTATLLPHSVLLGHANGHVSLWCSCTTNQPQLLHGQLSGPAMAVQQEQQDGYACHQAAGMDISSNSICHIASCAIKQADGTETIPRIVCIAASQDSKGQHAALQLIGAQMPSQSSQSNLLSASFCAMSPAHKLQAPTTAISLCDSATHAAAACADGTVHLFALDATACSKPSDAAAPQGDQLPTNVSTGAAALHKIAAFKLDAFAGMQSAQLALQHAPLLFWQHATGQKHHAQQACAPRSLLAHAHGGTVIVQQALQREHSEKIEPANPSSEPAEAAAPAATVAPRGTAKAPAAAAAPPERPSSKQEKRSSARLGGKASNTAAVPAAGDPGAAEETPFQQLLPAASSMLTLPCGICCSAATPSCSELLLALANGSIVLYSTALQCILAVSSCMVDRPTCISFLEPSKEQSGAIMSGAAGQLVTWNCKEGHLSVVQPPPPFTYTTLLPVDSQPPCIVAHTACGRTVVLDARDGSIVSEIVLPDDCRCAKAL